MVGLPVYVVHLANHRQLVGRCWFQVLGHPNVRLAESCQFRLCATQVDDLDDEAGIIISQNEECTPRCVPSDTAAAGRLLYA
jgi:hypothetical protein